MKLIQYKKYLFKPIKLNFTSYSCEINGILLNYYLKLKKNNILVVNNNVLINQINNSKLFINKTYFRTFLSLLDRILDGVSFGFKAVLKLKGKGLRLQLKKVNNILHIYLKLGYSHKIFFKLPENTWIYIYERRRSLILYSLNYCNLRNFLLKIRNYYPVNLYKIRGFFEPTEIIKQKKGNLDLVLGQIINKLLVMKLIKLNLLLNIFYYKNIKKKNISKINPLIIKAGLIKFIK